MHLSNNTNFINTDDLNRYNFHKYAASCYFRLFAHLSLRHVGLVAALVAVEEHHQPNLSLQE